MEVAKAGVAGLIALAAMGVACSSDAESGDAGGVGVRAAFEAAEPAQRVLGSSAQSIADRGAAARLPTVGPSVIKTAVVRIDVGGAVQRAVGDATEIAGRFGGFIASTTLSGGDAAMGTVVMRVPAEDFEGALNALEDLGSIDERSVSGEDVSQQFVDLQARLRNWESQEAVLLRLMDRSRSVSDTIRVQGELSRVQLEIERLRGRLNYLEDRTSLGTITASFTGIAGPPANPGPLGRAWERAWEAAESVVAAVIVGLGFVVPIALLCAAVALVVRGLRPRLMPRS